LLSVICLSDFNKIFVNLLFELITENKNKNMLAEICKNKNINKLNEFILYVICNKLNINEL